MKPTDPRKLVLRAQAGNRDAQDELLRGIQRPLYAYVRGLTADGHLAEDATQQAFVQVLRGLRWLRDPRFFRAWAFRIASREAMRALRRRGIVIDPDDAPEPIDEAHEPIGADERKLLLERVDRLSPASRAVVLLVYLEELSLAETADVLDLPLGTVKSRLAYGLAQLRNQE